jgi:hypothetical protein
MIDKTHHFNLFGLTQNDRIKYWFKHIKPTITALEAMQHLGIYRLASRINELKSEIHIESERISVSNRFNETCYVCEYKIIN